MAGRLARSALAAVAAAGTVGVLGVVPAAAAGPSTAPDWTIHYRGADGTVVRTWHGSRAAAERLLHRTAPGTGATAAIQRVSCHLPTTYWVFRGSGLTCYRYSGAVHVRIGGVYEVDSGNNSGRYIEGGRSHWLDRYTTDLWPTRITVSYIGIA